MTGVEKSEFFVCHFFFRQFMRGRKVSWIPGLDHAGLATQMVVERHLLTQEKSQSDANPRFKLGRDAFVKEIWKWKDT